MMTDEELDRVIAEIEAREMPGPNKFAAVVEVMIPHLTEKLQAENDPVARKELRRRLRSNRSLLRWAKTRAGYRPPA